MNFILYILVRLDYDRWCQSQIHIYKMFIIHSSAKRNKKKKNSQLVRAVPLQAGELSHDIDR